MNLEEAMEALRQGDKSALAPIYEQTKGAVYAIALSILKSPAPAEDIMQDTYLNVRRYILSYQKGTSAKAWIATMAKNLALNAYKKRKREQPTDFALREDLHGKTEEAGDNDRITWVLKHLKQDSAQIVLMHTLGGFTHLEIAKMMHRPSATVRWQYSKALEKLRKILEEEGTV